MLNLASRLQLLIESAEVFIKDDKWLAYRDSASPAFLNT